MSRYALQIEWSTSAVSWVGRKAETHSELEEPLEAANPEAALELLQRERPFLRGLPWHFAGQNFRLIELVKREVHVGEKFIPVTVGYD